MALTEDAWLSRRLGVPAHRLSGAPPEALPAGLVYAKAEVGDLAPLSRLQDAGFRLVDTAVSLECPLPLPSPADAGGRIRPARADDEDAVAEIARTAFTYDRFHGDPAIDDAVADGIKEAWARNHFAGGRGDGMAVAEADGAVAGFLLLLRDGGTLVIDLIAVAAGCRGRGLARGMIAHAAGMFEDGTTMRVGTQLANIPSVRLYESMGFRLVAAHHVLHRHG